MANNDSNDDIDTNLSDNENRQASKIFKKKALNPMHQLFVEALYCVCLSTIMELSLSVQRFTSMLVIIAQEYISKIGKYYTNSGAQAIRTSSQKAILVKVNDHIDTLAEHWLKLWQHLWANDSDETNAKLAFTTLQQSKCKEYIQSYRKSKR